MSLTMGSGPFGHRPAGRFNVEIPVREVLFVEPSPRWIRAERGGETVVDSRRAKLLHQHGVLARYFVPREDVRWEWLGDVQPASELATACAYKGVASYFSTRVGDELLENIAWSYREPRHDAAPVRDLVCFFNEAVDLEVDGELQARPETPWGRPGWWRDYTEER